MENIYKDCKKCNITKTLDDFHKDKTLKDGHKNTCKVCSIKKQENIKITTKRKKVKEKENGK